MFTTVPSKLIVSTWFRYVLGVRIVHLARITEFVDKINKSGSYIQTGPVILKESQHYRVTEDLVR